MPHPSLPDAPEPLSGKLGTACAAQPERTAILSGDRRTTYAALDDLARAIAGIGIGAGERVAIRVGPKDLLVAALLGVIRSGAIAVPLDRDEPDQQRALVDDAGASLILHDDTLSMAPGGTAARRVSDLADAPRADVPRIGADAACMMLYTSGTLGTRKGVLLSQANLAATVDYMTAFMGLDGSLVEYVGSPVDHAFGFGRCRAVICNGGTLVLDDGAFSPIRALSLIEREGCNSVAMAATGMSMLVEHFPKQLARLGDRIRWVELGSVPMRTELMERLVDLLPNARIVMNYGMTEAQRSTMIDFRAERGRIGSVGRASPGCAIRTRDSAGKVVTGEPAVVEVAGPHVAMGYWGRDDLWSERMDGGWFETDDLGIVDGEGYLTFIGRRDDMINIGGDKISPVDIEHRIGPELADAVFTVCAIADPAGLYGEVPALCIETDAPEEAAAAIDWQRRRRELAKGMPDFMVPRCVFAVDRIPRTGNGKIQRRALRRRIETGDCTEI